MPKDKKYKPKAKPMPYFEPEGMEREYKAKPMPYFGPEGMERDYKAKPMPYYEDDDMGLEAAAQGAAEGVVGEAIGRKKGGKVKMHKMPGGKIMKNSDMKKKKKMGGGMMSDESFQYSKGGMVRGQGIAIKGTKFKGIF